jgi:Cft2 family RNA processing exonuclease
MRGSPGPAVDGEKTVTIFGERITVRASIRTLGGFSAHAGQDDLVQWFARMASGDGIRAHCPALGDVIKV